MGKGNTKTEIIELLLMQLVSMLPPIEVSKAVQLCIDTAKNPKEKQRANVELKRLFDRRCKADPLVLELERKILEKE